MGESKRCVVVIGASGMLGSDLIEQLDAHKVDVHPVWREDLDIASELDVHRLIKQANPAVVINCAAYTNVAEAETKRDHAFKVNADGPATVAKACEANGARLIHFSTDYVFDGEAFGSYSESDQTNPLNVYGESKLAGEQRVRAISSRAVILRVQGLYGKTGTSFLKKLLQRLKSQARVEVVDDQFCTPSSTFFVSKVIEHVLLKPDLKGIFHASHDDYCTWCEFAEYVSEKLMKRDDMIIPVQSDKFPSPVRRPMNSRMSNQKLRLGLGFSALGTWREDFDAFLRRFSQDLA